MCGTVFFDLFVVHASIFPHHFEQATRPEMFLIECTAKYRDSWEFVPALSVVGNFIKFRELRFAPKVVLGVNFDAEFFSQFELHN